MELGLPCFVSGIIDHPGYCVRIFVTMHMGRSLFVFAFCLLAFSCQNDPPEPEITEDRLEGTWELIEVLFDSGDGNGVFETSNAGFEITLRPDNTFQANYHVCRIFEEGDRKQGEYTRIGIQELLIPCNGDILNGIEGRIEEGFLIFYYPCVTPCVYKFRKTADFTE